VPRKLPGVKVEPVVGHLDLVAIDDLLLENAVAIPQTVAPGGVVQARQTVEEASREAAKTAIAQGGVVLLLDHILNAEAKV